MSFQLNRHLSKERKIILLVGAVLLLAGALYRFWPQVDWLGDQQTQRALKEQKLARLKQAVANGPEIDRHLAMLKRTLKRADRYLLTGSTTALAGVLVQRELSKIADELKVELKQVQVLESGSAEKEAYTPIRVQVRSVSTLRQLQSLIYKIETSSKLFRVKELKIDRVSARRKSKNNVQGFFIIEGLMQSPTPDTVKT